MAHKYILVISVSITLLLSHFSVVMAEVEAISPVRVTDQIFVIGDKGGTVGVFIGKDGTFLIDDSFASLTKKIVTAVKSVGGDYPEFLINTHFHGDHTGGNENLGNGGTLIFAHDTVRQRLKDGSYIKAFDKKMEPTASAGLPVVTFSEGISFHINGDTVRVIHVSHAHTDGDSFIVFEKANVIHTGDIMFNGFYPFIDVDHGGSLPGTIQGVDKILSFADDETVIIPGHGPLGNKVQLQQYREMLWTAYGRLKKLKEDGKTALKAADLEPLVDLEPIWGDGMFSGDEWIELIYPGI